MQPKSDKHMEHNHLSRGLVAEDHSKEDKQDYIAFKYTGMSAK